MNVDAKMKELREEFVSLNERFESLGLGADEIHDYRNKCLPYKTWMYIYDKYSEKHGNAEECLENCLDGIKSIREYLEVLEGGK